MSKIGRKSIPITSAQITIENSTVRIKGPNAEFTHELPEGVLVEKTDGALQLKIAENTRKNRMMWGLHRALLANKIQGAQSGFEKKITIVGLGYKVQASGKKLTFSLGYSHKIDFELPEGVTLDVDKKGQKLLLKSADKFLLGKTCDEIRSFRKPEPYKGTGIIRDGDILIRKAGKAKSA